jgi:DNA-binding response OmpR family regulator
VLEARTGAEAVRIALGARPDAILLDYLLPDSEGVGVLKEMRAKGVVAPVIALTGHGDETIAHEFILAGAADFLSKDDLPEYRLLLTLRNALMLASAAP